MWPALLVIAASAFLKHQANEEAVSRQRNIRQAMENYQRLRAAETEQATEDLLKKQTPKERGQELQQVTNERAQSLRDTVGAAQAFDAAPTAGKQSQDFKAAQEAEANTIAERTRRAIQQLATMGAPGEQEQRFGMRFGRAAGTVDAANRASANVGASYLNDINGVRPDPFLTTVGDIGMAVGSGMAAAPAAAGATAGAGTAEEAAALGIHGPQFVPTAPTFGQRVSRAFSLFGGTK